MLDDRLGQFAGIVAPDPAMRATERAPDAGGVPVDPAPGDRVGRAGRRIRRGNAQQLEAAHRTEAFGELTIIKPAPVPFLAHADGRVDDDAKGDYTIC